MWRYGNSGHRDVALHNRLLEGGGRRPSAIDQCWCHFQHPGIETRRSDEAALRRDARMINMVQLGQVLNPTGDLPVKALFVYGSNPAAVCPNHDEVVRGLVWPDLFTVVHEQFFTDTSLRRPSLSRRTCRKPMGIITCRYHAKPLRRLASVVQMSSCSGPWLSAWVLKKSVSPRA
jgi:hypothetical protein